MKTITKEQITEIKQRFKDGETLASVVKAMNISRNSVKKYVNESDEPNTNSKGDILDSSTEKKYVSKATETTSEVMKRELDSTIKTGLALRSASYKYQTSVENMGVEWEDFLGFSIEIGYDTLVDAYQKELEKQELIDSIDIAGYEQALHEESVKSLAEEGKEDE
jgi:hypothetical protein